MLFLKCAKQKVNPSDSLTDSRDFQCDLLMYAIAQYVHVKLLYSAVAWHQPYCGERHGLTVITAI